MLLWIIPIVVGALCTLGGILAASKMDALDGATRSRAGLVAIVVAALLFLALVIMQLVYSSNWLFWLVIAAVAVPLALAIRTRWAGHSHAPFSH